MLDKLDDLENRSRRSNLRIIGIPETVKQDELIHICEEVLPTALGLRNKMTVERAHRIGALQKDRKGFRPVIAKYLI